MAETAVNFVTETLIRSLENEVRLQLGLKSEVEKISKHLQTMKAHLREADERAESSNTNNTMKDWVRNVREIAHDIEDVIDDYKYQVARRRTKRRDFVGLARGFVTGIVSSHRINDEIQEINARILRYGQMRESLGLTGGDAGGGGGGSNGWSWQDQKLLEPLVERDQFVGFRVRKEELDNYLTHGKSICTVIPIVGSGGHGKTSLVNQVYRFMNENTFTRRAWVDVTRSYEIRDILKKLIKQLKSDNRKNKGIESDMDIRLLNEEVKNCLREFKCLIVFDDVWDTNFWNSIKNIIPPRSASKSRIIITTRDQEVAKNCMAPAHTAQVKPLRLKPLEFEEAEELFNCVVFDGKKCPTDLQILSRKIIQKCEGIPRSITTIGSLLSNGNTDYDVSKWQNVSKNLGRILANHNNHPKVRALNAAVSESYYNLPYHLKLCFLYLGVFPEGYPINCNRLVRLWIAEGFVQTDLKTETLEDVGMNYLQEMILRNLLQATVFDIDGKVRTCKVQDTMRGFILTKFTELNFCQVLDKIESDLNSSSFPRRLSIQQDYSEIEFFEVVSHPREVRSCILFNAGGISKSVITTFKLMRTLDFDDAPLNVVPEEIGQLLLLEYLGLRNTRIENLPRSIGKLRKLLTLDLKNTRVKKLPKEIKKLMKLRHLLGYSYHGSDDDFDMASCFQGLQIKEGFGNFTNLQKLYSIDCQGDSSVIKELRKLKQLRKLGITGLTGQNGRDLCWVIETLTCLASLWIGAKDVDEFLELESINNPPKNLQRLYLEGRLRKLPEWIPNLRKLVRLRLNSSRLTHDPIYALRNSNELLELRLRMAYQGEELHFKTGWLGKLKILHLRNLEPLKILKIDDKALRQLQKLYVGPLPHMAEVPDDIRNLKKLQVLRFYDMSDSFTDSIRPGKPKYDIFKHIPPAGFKISRKKQHGVNGYVNNSLHLANLTMNRYVDEEHYVTPNNLISEGKPPSGDDKATNRWLFLVQIVLAAGLFFMLNIVSHYLEQLSYLFIEG
ncbi:disease resistance protein RPM1-like [Prosopis cineraria]|uniref:disease resistance protein RPM1-like n=1 Tax=Prosopis cineraria TaxID=364024 RepID=UPI00240F15B0|nr:disease resistance protein RPM1-like [Prosopis cineraria]